MLMDFTLKIREREQWPLKVVEALEDRMAESGAEVLGKSADGTLYALRMEIDGDLWDAAQEYQAVEADLGSYGPVSMPERPLINGMGDQGLATMLHVLADDPEGARR